MILVETDALVCTLVVTMALYKSVEIYTAKYKVEQVVMRADRLLPGFKASSPDQSLRDLASSPPTVSDALLRHLVWLRRLHVDYGFYALILLLGMFGLLGFGVMLIQNLRQSWGATIVIAACTMLVSLYGALINLEIEALRLRLDSAAPPSGSGITSGCRIGAP